MNQPDHSHGMPAHSYAGSVPIGGYFQERHRALAREYYERPENRGFCPPGLAKKSNGCLQPGQARKWREGYPLPAGMVYYEVPRSMVISLGVPPSGYRYVRVASDILLIAIGTNMVLDAMQDLVH
jgi:Ni/Co efflux regulator RcnB